MDTTKRYDSLFAYFGARVAIEPAFLKAVAIAESALDPRAVSHAGAQGLMQFMPATWQEWRPHGEASPFCAEDAIDAASRMLNWLFNTPLTQGDISLVLAAYNWGYGNVRNAIEDHGEAWREAAPRETQEYIHRILGIYSALSEDDDDERET